MSMLFEPATMLCMPQYFYVDIEHQSLNRSRGTTHLKIGFGKSAQNNLIVPDAIAAISDLDLEGGHLVKFDGPASLPVAMALAHAVAHRFEVVACRDPKLGKFVVAISHHPDYLPGQLID